MKIGGKFKGKFVQKIAEKRKKQVGKGSKKFSGNKATSKFPHKHDKFGKFLKNRFNEL